MENLKAGAILKTSELRIGDHVKMVSNVDEGWNSNIVQKIRDNLVYLWRPYGTEADFDMGDSIICYIGVEEWAVEKNHSNIRWKLLRSRREPKNG